MNKRKAIVNTFIFANFNYCPLVWHSCSKRTMEKIENIQKRALRFYVMATLQAMKTYLRKTKVALWK